MTHVHHRTNGVVISKGVGVALKAVTPGGAKSVLAVAAANAEPAFTADPTIESLTLSGGELVITPTIGAAIVLIPFGTGAGQTAEIRFRELVANGTNRVGVKAPDSVTADYTITLPGAPPSVGGSTLVATTGGVTSWQPWVGARSVLTYGASIAINAALGNWFSVSVTDNVAHDFAAPSNPTTGQTFMLLVRNTSGGAIATASFNAAFKTAGYAAPANGESTAAMFGWDGTNHVQLTPWTAAIPN